MHVSLTPELEAKVRSKVESGLYNNASEVIREALRFMEQNQELLMQLKLDRLRAEVEIGAKQAEKGEFSLRTVQDIVADMNECRNK
ncbi:type II toxin-antitoxin system ParD family antitoxin [bacterium]|nr:type II toxin-antitoxin system ParD family antitoxin [bacterium]